MANNANVMNGSDLCLFITSGATTRCIALASSCKISITMGTRKVASKDSGNSEESLPTRYNWTCDSDSLFTQDYSGANQSATTTASGFTYDSLLDIMLQRIPITTTFGLVANPGTGWLQTLGTGRQIAGKAYITKLDLNSKDNDNVTYTVALEGTSTLTHA